MNREGFNDFAHGFVLAAVDAVAIVMFIGMVGVWIINREQIWRALS